MSEVKTPLEEQLEAAYKQGVFDHNIYGHELDIEWSCKDAIALIIENIPTAKAGQQANKPEQGMKFDKVKELINKSINNYESLPLSEKGVNILEAFKWIKSELQLIDENTPLPEQGEEKENAYPINKDVLIGIIASNMGYHLPADSIKAGEEIYEYIHRCKPVTSTESAEQETWQTTKPEFNKECFLMTETLYGTNKEYRTWWIKKLCTPVDEQWYWGWLELDGEEYGDIADLKVNRYLVIELPGTK